MIPEPATVVRNLLIKSRLPIVPAGRIVVGRVPVALRISPYTAIFTIVPETRDEISEGVSIVTARIQISTWTDNYKLAADANRSYMRILDTETAKLQFPVEHLRCQYLGGYVFQEPDVENIFQSFLEYYVLYQYTELGDRIQDSVNVADSVARTILV